MRRVCDQYGAGVKYVETGAPRGKNGALNAGVAVAGAPVLVMTDVDARIAAPALQALLEGLADPGTGGVCGQRVVATADAAGNWSDAQQTYMSLDSRIKAWESARGSITANDGKLYAVKRSLMPLVPDGVTDDFFVSTCAIAQGGRLYFEEEAVARGPVADTADAEFARKVRLMTRGIGSVLARRALLDPARTGFYAVQLLTHKLLRRLCGVPVLVALIATPWLWSLHPFYRVALPAQVAVHGLAMLAWAKRESRLGRSAPLAIPLFFDLVNVAGILALVGHLRGKRHLGWVPHRASGKSAPSAGGAS
jgi:hypothetical protein